MHVTRRNRAEALVKRNKYCSDTDGFFAARYA